MKIVFSWTSGAILIWFSLRRHSWSWIACNWKWHWLANQSLIMGCCPSSTSYSDHYSRCRFFTFHLLSWPWWYLQASQDNEPLNWIWLSKVCRLLCQWPSTFREQSFSFSVRLAFTLSQYSVNGWWPLKESPTCLMLTKQRYLHFEARTLKVYSSLFLDGIAPIEIDFVGSSFSEKKSSYSIGSLLFLGSL